MYGAMALLGQIGKKNALLQRVGVETSIGIASPVFFTVKPDHLI